MIMSKFERILQQVVMSIQTATELRIFEAVRELLCYTPVSAHDLAPENMDEKRGELVRAGYDLVLYRSNDDPKKTWVLLHELPEKVGEPWKTIRGFEITLDIEMQVEKGKALTKVSSRRLTGRDLQQAVEVLGV